MHSRNFTGADLRVVPFFVLFVHIAAANRNRTGAGSIGKSPPPPPPLPSPDARVFFAAPDVTDAEFSRAVATWLRNWPRLEPRQWLGHPILVTSSHIKSKAPAGAQGSANPAVE
jgi:hypothetical protein